MWPLFLIFKGGFHYFLLNYTAFAHENSHIDKAFLHVNYMTFVPKSPYVWKILWGWGCGLEQAPLFYDIDVIFLWIAQKENLITGLHKQTPHIFSLTNGICCRVCGTLNGSGTCTFKNRKEHISTHLIQHTWLNTLKWASWIRSPKLTFCYFLKSYSFI